MCGISGVWDFKNKLKNVDFEEFTNSLIHRGPDGFGYAYFSDHTLGLGHRRLSILDVSENGKQPMYSHDKRYCIVYNGEIFNFIELRKELEGKGYSFRSDSDTEVVIAAYHCWGESCLDKFNGMWAFVIWDEEESCLFLARDRFGIKPLYYTYSNDHLFAFASETNAFKKLAGFNREIDDKLAGLSMNDPYLLEGKGYTIFRNVFQLLPGHYMKIYADKFTDQKRWYDIRERLTFLDLNYDQSVQKFTELFRDSCKLRLRSDVPIATALSGGLDSSSVFVTIHDIMNKGMQNERVSDEWQKAVIGVFPGTDVDEREFADKVVDSVGGSKIYADIGLSKGLPDYVESSTRHFDAIASTPFISMLGVYGEMQKNGIKVSMDGHGVDEMMFGYRGTVYDIYNHHLYKGNLKRAREVSMILSKMYTSDQVENRKTKFAEEIAKAEKYRSSLKYVIKSFLGKKQEVNIENAGLKSKSDSPYDFSHYNYEDRTQLELFFTTTLPSLLRNFDKAAMYSSVEIRMPFMDYRLVEFMLASQMKFRLGNGYTKLMLRDSMKGLLVDEIRLRTWKVGLGIPLKDWFENKIGDWVNDQVHSERFKSLYDDHIFFIKETDNLLKGNNSSVSYIELWKRINRLIIE